ncbi:hypothetical protein Drose_32770 [Dactylosporangium roseum]|uniref:Uncharacterized protein n=1 Tax=Dactylosporangium roseum TaxID=47989 RepID=A0ABY5Z409_9ACTN|nr:hypothetical protein [Dactylosporangium roseum]UWZ35818.1 hypothetical protein Drose_32770 [Dactylosporangium roseum]
MVTFPEEIEARDDDIHGSQYHYGSEYVPKGVMGNAVKDPNAVARRSVNRPVGRPQGNGSQRRKARNGDKENNC